MNFTQITYEKDGRVATITLNRPDRLNAFTPVMGMELIQALDAADADDEVRAIVVTGAGRGFCAGADLSAGPGRAFSSHEIPREEFRDGGGPIPLKLFDLKKPVIAAINGPAVGVGITMTLAMDVRLASNKAKMGFVFARRGIAMDACSSWFLPRIVGLSQSLDWVLSGRVFPAEEALAAGLVSRVLKPEELLPEALALARDIANNTSAITVALSRQLLWKMMGANHPMEAHRIESLCVHDMGRSEDCREGVASFLEKRPPRFTMKPSQDMPDFYPWWTDRPFKPV